MSKELVFGHKVPDTDAIVAAMALAYLKKQDGYDVEAVALGEPNAETKYVLDYFDTKAPRVISRAKPEVDKVMLVDHNEPQQSVSDIDQLTVTDVVDHHRINGFNTAAPLYYRAAPYGCCSTILTQMFSEEGIKIPKKLAGLMLSAIISDTLLLKSPTTTDFDRDALKALADIAGIDDYEDYGVKMLKAGTDVDSKTDQQLIDGDAKSFTMGGKSVRIDQINVVDLDDITKRADDVKKAMEAEAKDKGYDLFLVLVTNILDSNSELIVVGEPKSVVEKAFDNKFNADDIMNLPGVVSRKKQVVPPLTDALEK
ncbi:manganese-dependent inorganic pyrophosphatase [Fructilactobacillus fructivorans]|uniref:Probable manganese-dependent inorganic pyrophosphatase n=1 Tax=Fructilactobacillus fructivorans TaxID=1614 RepID=A0A0C1M7W7_9LACO|nr:manganese-dependent inorganic pyrophosphatase [Fructilactobacillus fructivorans]KID42574.1 Manganese-dependent inorganic pyrophosphatase [Fructilactobacillus fructivorans]KRK58650.1 manganese-dependent inorganic pyrophosphatase [Fructilactobacillus fructivorans]MCT0151800.1 manganese-dependent inorganic pyrophosphatase [Fructilactobacillus fructivorans]MCT2868071.1 manganese-dependent inorganic pyrophosphatase [Fructilactobacillus fructivorans]MCT2868723.1 manganese-dependent inorganic pyro